MLEAVAFWVALAAGELAGLVIPLGIYSPSDADGGELFGPVVLLPLGISVGGFGDSHAGMNSGSVVIFERERPTSPLREHRLISNSPGVGDAFGFSVAFSEDQIFVGAPGVDDCAPNSGAVYVFDRDPITGIWTQSDVLFQ